MTAGTVTRPLTDEDIETLETLALRHKPGCDVPFIAGVLSHSGFTPQKMQDAWEAFQEAVHIRESLSVRGGKPWFEVYDHVDLRGREDSNQGAAIQMAVNAADEARNHFVFGGPLRKAEEPR